MGVKKFFAKPGVLLAFSAILSALPLTFSELFILSWVSYAPLFYVLITQRDDDWRLAVKHGFSFGFIYYFLVYYWFWWFYPLDYAGLSSAASIAAVLLASVGISLAHGLLWCIPFVICLVINKLSKNPLYLSFAGIVSILAIQKITALSELSFPWVRVSLGQYKATALIQSASLFGIDGVDFIILCVNALITLAIITKSKKQIASIAVAIAIFVCNLSFGLIRLRPVSYERDLKILAVQGSVSQEEKWSRYGDTISLDVYSRLTKENITEDVDLILWPESAIPLLYEGEEDLTAYKKISKELDTPILAGILIDRGGYNTNSSILIDKDGVIANYAKRQLVPFGEYMPYEQIFLKILPFLNLAGDDYTPGDSSEIMQMENGKIGNVICFESIYPALCRQSTLDGAEVIMELSNDSWLKDSPAMQQHLSHAVFRSVENSRYVVRSANSGISAVIDSRGNIKSQLDIDYQGTLNDTAYYDDSITLYTKTGDVLFPVCCAAFVVWSAVYLIMIIKNKKSAK